MHLRNLALSFFSLAFCAVHGQMFVPNNDPLLHFHGRWDSSPGSWWASTGLKLNVENLKSLTLNLEPHTTPLAGIGVSLNYEPFFNITVNPGRNIIPLRSLNVLTWKDKTIVRINSFGWQNNRINLESISLNPDARLLPYVPSKLAFQFIGDSLSAASYLGQFLPQGVDQAWPFLVGEAFKAENVIIAQPGIALTNIPSYGNPLGMSEQFFLTEDAGYVYSSDHNYTTPWDFKRDVPAPNVVVLHIGYNYTIVRVLDGFTYKALTAPMTAVKMYPQTRSFNAGKNYLNFLTRLRTIYKTQMILILTPWGWPQPDGTVSYYYQGKFQEIMSLWQQEGDDNSFLVDTTGWVSYDDVFPDNLHPTVSGHEKIANLFGTWLKNFGILPQQSWGSSKDSED